MPGTWETPLFDFGPSALDKIVAIHLIHLHTGEFLALDGGQDVPFSTPKARLWTPPAIGVTGPGTFLAVPNNRTRLWCCGHCARPDGKILTSGGWFVPGSGTLPASNHTDLFGGAIKRGE